MAYIVKILYFIYVLYKRFCEAEPPYVEIKKKNQISKTALSAYV